jgi:hypothetical protein
LEAVFFTGWFSTAAIGSQAMNSFCEFSSGPNLLASRQDSSHRFASRPSAIHQKLPCPSAVAPVLNRINTRRGISLLAGRIVSVAARPSAPNSGRLAVAADHRQANF